MYNQYNGFVLGFIFWARSIFAIHSLVLYFGFIYLATWLMYTLSNLWIFSITIFLAQHTYAYGLFSVLITLCLLLFFALYTHFIFKHIKMLFAEMVLQQIQPWIMHKMIQPNVALLLDWKHVHIKCCLSADINIKNNMEQMVSKHTYEDPIWHSRCL